MMKGKAIIILIVLICLFCDGLNCEVLCVLDKLLAPDSFEICHGRLYIGQGAEFFIYSIQDGSLIKKFGNKGEGPGEILLYPGVENSIYATSDKLVVVGSKKIIYFDQNHNFLLELRKANTLFRMLPFADMFAAYKSISNNKSRQSVSVLHLLDDDLKEIKEIARKVIYIGIPLHLPADTIQYDVYKNQLFVERSESENEIEIYNTSGEKIKTIQTGFKPIKITSAKKKMILEDLKTDSYIAGIIKRSGGWENAKKWLEITWGESLPFINNLVVNNKRIYIQSSRINQGKVEYLSMDLDGKGILQYMLPRVQEAGLIGRLQGRGTKFWDIYQNKFYYIQEDTEDDAWVLYFVDLKSKEGIKRKVQIELSIFQN